MLHFTKVTVNIITALDLVEEKTYKAGTQSHLVNRKVILYNSSLCQ